MKLLIAGLIILVCGQAVAASLTQAFPSCDINEQRNVKADNNSSTGDTPEAHITMRINVLQADISTARKARHLTQSQADIMWQYADRIRNDATHHINEQGFLGAAERASYDRELDDVATDLCRHITANKP